MPDREIPIIIPEGLGRYLAINVDTPCLIQIRGSVFRAKIIAILAMFPGLKYSRYK